MEDRAITVTERAQKNISNMLARVGAIAQTFGESSIEYTKAAETLMVSFAQVLRLGGHISAEDELNLYGASFIHYGVIWHSSRAKPEGKYENIDQQYLDLIGSWSVHS